MGDGMGTEPTRGKDQGSCGETGEVESSVPGGPRGLAGRRGRRPSLPVASGRFSSFFPLQETRPSAEVAETRGSGCRGDGQGTVLGPLASRGPPWHLGLSVSTKKWSFLSSLI